MTYKEIAEELCEDYVKMLDYEYSSLPCSNSYGKIIECDYKPDGLIMSDEQVKKCSKCYLNFLRAGQPMKDKLE